MGDHTSVNIDRLDAMRVIVARVTSQSPEVEAIDQVLDRARMLNLDVEVYRVFGYDNCQQHPNHTYTAWLTVGDTTAPQKDIRIKEFEGGLFATKEVVGVEQISPGWQQLVQWCQDSSYHTGSQPGLEEHLNVTDDCPLDQRQFRLYLSIAE